tara:strand:+ start:346 stop:501 length:156 start_codon:yes stop_codon:yes gene_type:complete
MLPLGNMPDESGEGVHSKKNPLNDRRRWPPRGRIPAYRPGQGCQKKAPEEG